ncbi:MAG: glycerol kinase, partial [Lachnospiraceae bacterium]|nr:glycerol kinase [Lachnospiraceae bacterium]
DSWLVYNLSNEKTHATDVTNASRTMLFNIHTLAWDPELLNYFNIPEAMLPEVKKSSDLYGTCRIADLMLNGVPICGVAGDQQSALFGQGCLSAGQAKNTYGTGCFLLMNTGEKAVDSKHRLLTTMAAQVGDTVQYALEGSVFMGGACVQWLRDSLGILSTAAESEGIAESVPDTLGAYLVPAFTGLGAPYWDPYARGALVGMTRGFKKEHLVRATLESIAYQVYDVVHAMEQDLQQALAADGETDRMADATAANIPGLTSLQVDGGASANRFLMQFQADILGRPVVRPACIETTALGAALLAGLYVGFWSSEAVTAQDATADTFLPKMEEPVRAEKLAGWKEAVLGVIHGA